jgi:hypothetical protein
MPACWRRYSSAPHVFAVAALSAASRPLLITVNCSQASLTVFQTRVTVILETPANRAVSSINFPFCRRNVRISSCLALSACRPAYLSSNLVFQHPLSVAGNDPHSLCER